MHDSSLCVVKCGKALLSVIQAHFVKLWSGWKLLESVVQRWKVLYNVIGLRESSEFRVPGSGFEQEVTKETEQGLYNPEPNDRRKLPLRLDRGEGPG